MSGTMKSDDFYLQTKQAGQCTYNVILRRVSANTLCTGKAMVKVKYSRYRLGGAQRVPGSIGSQIT